MEYQVLLEAIEEFILTDNIAVWNNKVRPLLTKLVQSRAYGTCKMAILRQTRMFFTDNAGRTFLINATELAALRACRNEVARKAVWKRILGSVGVVSPYVLAALFVFTTASDGYALSQVVSSDNQQQYADYMNKYLGYIVKTEEREGYTDRFPPPMTYEKWLNKDKNLAWWQQ